MNTHYLHLFVRIAATKNISSAGKELGLSPAVASSHMNKLESDLGVKLLHRTTRQVSLTEEGHAFLPYAEDVLADIDSARAAIGSGHIEPTGTLRITAPASFGRMHLVPALNVFLERYPQLNLDLRLSDTILDMVEGGFDISIRNSALHDSSFVATKLASDKRLLFASPSYLERFGSPTIPEDLLQHRCITLPALDSWHFDTPTGKKSIKNQSQLRIDNGEAIRDACLNGYGITICSQWCAYEYVQRGELVPVLTDYPLVSNTAIWAVYPSTRLLAPKVRLFIDFLKQHFGRKPYWEF